MSHLGPYGGLAGQRVALGRVRLRAVVPRKRVCVLHDLCMIAPHRCSQLTTKLAADSAEAIRPEKACDP